MFARRQELLEREAERIGGLAVVGDVTSADDLERLVRTAVDAYGGSRHPREQLGRPAAGERRRRARRRAGRGSRPAPARLGRAPDRALPAVPRAQRGAAASSTSRRSTVREPIDNLALSNVVRPGVVGWAKSLARELGPKGITVNSSRPGRIDTDRIREVYPDGPTAGRPRGHPARPARHDARDRRRRRVPLLGARLVRQRHRRPGRRRADARPV